MKTGIKQPMLYVLLICILPLSCINAQFNKGDGNITKSERKISDFNYIEVEDGIDLYLTQGNTTELTIEADQNLHEYIVTEVEDDVLKIHLSKIILRAKSIKVYLNVVNIKGLIASGGSDVQTSGTLKLNDFSAICSGGSDIKLNIEANELKFKASGGSDGFISGKASIFNAMASGGSDIKAFDLSVTDCQIEISGGSDAEINVAGQLKAQGSGGSDISYKGNPSNIDSNMSGGSDLIHRQ
jgi:hypothetical protein